MHWSHVRRYQGAIAVGAALLALAGCAGAGAAPTATAAATQPPAATATLAPVTFAPTVDAASVSGACAQSMMAPVPPLVNAHGLLVSQVNSSLTFPGNQVPQSAGDKPLKLTATPTGMPVYGGAEGGGGSFSVCNPSMSQTITLQSIVVRITGFEAFNGALSAWQPCHDSRYDALTRALAPANCEGGSPANERLHASFPGAASVGATVTASQVSSTAVTQSDPNPYPPLPLALAPGQSVIVDVALTAPTTPGTYTFAVGLVVGSAAPAYFSATQPTLYAPVAQAWSGQNCLTSAMQSQIPAATQDTYYICPPTP